MQAAKGLLELERYLDKVCAHGDIFEHLDPWIRGFFGRRMLLLSASDFDDSVDAIIGQAALEQDAQSKRSTDAWQSWAASSFERGAGRAHRFTKAKAMQEVLDWGSLTGGQAQPYTLVDKAMSAWERVWSLHDATLELPADAGSWEQLPPISSDDLRRVALTFPWQTGTGQWSFAPRSFWYLSDEALHVLAQLLMACERLRCWPAQRIATQLVRLPKESGGSRLIALINTILRLWGRVRQPIAADWQKQNEHAAFWGVGAGRSSSDCAFSHNMDAEIGHECGHDVVSVFIDMMKCFETVLLSSLMVEARATHFPLTLAWMCIQTYIQPRLVKAYGSVSYPVVSVQGILAGCSMATSMLMVLLHRSLTATFAIHPTVTPRALIDDVSFQWVGERAGVTRARGERDPISELYRAVRRFVESVKPLGLVVQFAKCGFVASTKRARKRFAVYASALKLTAKKAMRNLGHELHGARVFRIQEEARVRKTAGRSRKLRALRRAVSDRVSRLWRTGLLPAGAHGAGVSGVSDSAVRRLRTQAGMLVGAKPMRCLTLYLATQPSIRYDPLFDSTSLIVGRYASWLWDERVRPSLLFRAWSKIRDRFLSKPSWAGARGPIASTWLSLLRVGWTMAAPHILVDDQARNINLYKECPADVLKFLQDGIQRWQASRILQYLPGSEGQTLWLRAARAAILSIKDRARRGALRTLWSAGVWTPTRLHSINLRDSPACFA